MRRCISTALAAAAALNLLAGAAGPLAQEPVAPPPPQPSAEPQPPPQVAQDGAQGGRVEAPASAGGATAPSRAERKARKSHARPHVKAAGAGSVTIKDFSFAPSSVTVNVGDSVTWSNSGKTSHTATASDGSFDTGTLNKGQSGSHTFTKAGTFRYICSIHPFMKGTVVVAAAGGSQSTSPQSNSPSSGSGSGSAGSTATPAQSAPGIPNTGVDVGWLLLSGGLLLGSGLLIRRKAA